MRRKLLDIFRPILAGWNGLYGKWTCCKLAESFPDGTLPNFFKLSIVEFYLDQMRRLTDFEDV